MHTTALTPRPALLALGLLGCVAAALALHEMNEHSQARSALERQQFDAALILTLYGNDYRTLPPTPDREPLQALRNRYPELDIPDEVTAAFTNQGNGYVLLMWVGALPEDARQKLLIGLQLVIQDTRRQGGDLAGAINAFHAHFRSTHSDGLTSAINGKDA